MRLAALLAATALTATSAFAQTPPPTPPAPPAAPNAGPFSIPMSRPTAPGPVEPLPAPKRFVTHHQTTNGAPDTTFRDIQKVYQLTYALRQFRADLAFEHSNKGIADDNPDNLPALTTAKDIKATLFHSYRRMSGVLENSDTALQQMTVTRDPGNANRVNIGLPLDFVNPLDIFAGLARAYSQFR